MSTQSSPKVKTALRVIEIIELFAKETQPLSLTEIARALEVPVSSCLALLRTLMQLGYLYETGRRQSYYPTGRLYTVAQKIYKFDPILEHVRPSLEALGKETSETVVLGKLTTDMKVLYIDAYQSSNPICYVAVAGMQRVVHANSMGKALLYRLPKEERLKIFKNRTLERFNDRTLTTVEALEQDLQQSFERGWFANLGESIEDVGGIAWPLELNGTPYAVSIAGPIYRIQQHLPLFAEQLRTMCRLIEEGAAGLFNKT